MTCYNQVYCFTAEATALNQLIYTKMTFENSIASKLICVHFLEKYSVFVYELLKILEHYR